MNTFTFLRSTHGLFFQMSKEAVWLCSGGQANDSTGTFWAMQVAIPFATLLIVLGLPVELTLDHSFPLTRNRWHFTPFHPNLVWRVQGSVLVPWAVAHKQSAFPFSARQRMFAQSASFSFLDSITGLFHYHGHSYGILTFLPTFSLKRWAFELLSQLWCRESYNMQPFV